MKGKTISVIIPVYKVEKYLDQCIASVSGQTYQNLEIILVDDGSPDSCGEICDKWAERDSRIKVIHKKNGGLSAARNTGLAAVAGEFVAFVDSDDLIIPTMMEELLSVLKEKKADIAECNYVCFSDEDEQKLKNEVSGEKTRSYTTKEALSLLIENRTFKYTVWNKIYRRDILNTLRFEVGKLHEDVFFTYQVFGHCKIIAKTEKTLYFYRQRSDSIMGSPFSIRSLDSLEARKRQYFFMKENYPELAGKAQSQVLGSCLYLGQKALKTSERGKVKKAMIYITMLFNEIYMSQSVQENKKQKIWYWAARRNFWLCCFVRNQLKIGL